jgi:hypothetical protein
MMERKRIYITVKTYPTLSEKYDELVCTAGICEDGSWIRLYPLPFRKLEHEQKYKKWQWIEVDVERRTQDFRPESYKVLNLDNLKIIPAKSDKADWDEFQKKDLFLFLGTRLRDQSRSPNPFSIVGVFYPPVDTQGQLF